MVNMADCQVTERGSRAEIYLRVTVTRTKMNTSLVERKRDLSNT